jgi:Tol biopolymer transport system component
MAAKFAHRARGIFAGLFLVSLPLAAPVSTGQQVELISINGAGTDSGNGSSGVSCRASASSDGRFVIFNSEATNLVAVGDTNGVADAFLRDRQTGTTVLISVNSAGTGTGNGHSAALQISPDGTRVLFQSRATDLVSSPAVSGGFLHLYVRNLANNTTSLVTVNSAGTGAGNQGSFVESSMSATGLRVAFVSRASNLVTNDTNGTATDVFLRDLTSGTTSLVSVNMAATGSGNRFSHVPSISADGTRVAFMSQASDLAANDTNGGGDGSALDVFLRDLTAGTTALLSVNTAGTDSGNSSSINPAISADGTRVLFNSSANDLVPTDANGTIDVFVRDLAAGTTSLASVNAAGSSSGNGGSTHPTEGRELSADGSRVVFPELCQ